MKLHKNGTLFLYIFTNPVFLKIIIVKTNKIIRFTLKFMSTILVVFSKSWCYPTVNQTKGGKSMNYIISCNDGSFFAGWGILGEEKYVTDRNLAYRMYSTIADKTVGKLQKKAVVELI